MGEREGYHSPWPVAISSHLLVVKIEVLHIYVVRERHVLALASLIMVIMFNQLK